MVDSHAMGGIMDDPFLILLLIFHYHGQRGNSPVLSELSLELAEGHPIHEAFRNIFIKFSLHEVLMHARGNVVWHPG